MNYFEVEYDGESRKTVKSYLVTYDQEKLEKILEELKKYKYISKDATTLLLYDTDDIFVLPRTKGYMKKSMVSFFESQTKHKEDKILDDTITWSIDKNHRYVIYNYEYERLPLLYHTLDIILYDRDITDYKGLYDLDYSTRNKDQVLINTIFDYDFYGKDYDNDIDEIKFINPECNYKELCKLQREALECFHFTPSTVKIYLTNQETEDGISFLKKRRKEE